MKKHRGDTRLKRGRRLVVTLAGKAAMGVFALALAVFLILPGSPAAAEPVSRLGGMDRYETAALVAMEKYTYAPTVIIARGDVYADGLAASTLAGVLDAPVLLTPPDTLPYVVRNAISRLGASRAIILGGEGAISRRVAAALEDTLGLQVERLSGRDRYETAALIARRADETSYLAHYAFIVNGYAPADSLVAGPAAFRNRAPILQVSRDRVPAETRRALRDLDIREVYIVGGTGVVSEKVRDELETLVAVRRRLSGSDRYATSVALAREFFPGAESFRLVRGDDANLADAIGVAVFGEPALYVRQYDIPAAVNSYIDDIISNYSQVAIIGGTGAVSRVVETTVENKISRASPRIEFAKPENLVLWPNGGYEYVYLYTWPAATRYTASSNRTAVARVTVDNDRLQVEPRSSGTATITVTASCPGYRSATQTFMVYVTNNEVSFSLPYSDTSPLSLAPGGSSEVTISGITSGAAMSVSSKNTAIATVTSLSNTKFRVTGVAAGETIVEVRGSREGIHSMTKTFKVIVSGAPLTPPGLTADTTDNNVDNPLEITFTDNPAWRSAISAVKIDNASQIYTAEPGKIILNPAENPSLQSRGQKTIVVEASGYQDATVNQTIEAGAATKLVVEAVYPEPGEQSGQQFKVVPKVTLFDRYDNQCSDGPSAAAQVTAAATGGQWLIGGTTTVQADAGIAAFTNLTCTTTNSEQGSITFTAAGASDGISRPFNLPATVTVSDNDQLTANLGYSAIRTINLAEGSYQKITVSRENLTIKGAGADTTSIAGVVNGTPGVSGKSNVHIEALKVEGIGFGNDDRVVAVSVYGASGFTVKGCEITLDATVAQDVYGIWSAGASNLTIENTKVTVSSTSGGEVYAARFGANGLTIKGCEFNSSVLFTDNALLTEVTGNTFTVPGDVPAFILDRHTALPMQLMYGGESKSLNEIAHQLHTGNGAALTRAWADPRQTGMATFTLEPGGEAVTGPFALDTSYRVNPVIEAGEKVYGKAGERYPVYNAATPDGLSISDVFDFNEEGFTLIVPADPGTTVLTTGTGMGENYITLVVVDDYNRVLRAQSLDTAIDY